MAKPTPAELALQAEIQQLRDRLTELEKERHAVHENHQQVLATLRAENDRLSTVIASITERKGAEADLQEQREWLRVTLDSIGDAVLATDEAARVTFINPVAARLTGWTAQEAVGRSAHDVLRMINEQTREPADDIIGRVLKENAVVALANHTALIARNGDEIPIEDTAAPIRDASGRATGAVLVFHDVTAKRRAQAELLAAHEQAVIQKNRLSAVLAALPTGVLLTDAQGGIIESNAAFDHVWGGPRPRTQSVADYVEYKAWWADSGQPVQAEEWASARAVRNGETVVNQEVEIERFDGSRATVLNSAAPIFDAQGRISGSAVAISDVTERKLAEERFRRSQKTFSELVERAPFGIYVVDYRFRVAHMNAASQTGAFRNVRPVIGRDFGEVMRILWPEPVAAEIIKHFRHTLETGEPYYSPRFFNPRRDVQVVEGYEWELHRMALPDGQFGVVCYYFDSTKLLEAQEALRESEARLQTTVDNLEEAVVAADPQGNVLHWNHRGAAMFGYDNPEQGRMPLARFPETFEAAELDGTVLTLERWPLSRILRGERLKSWEIRLRRWNTDWRRIFSFSGSLVRDRDGRPLLAVLSANDVTERKRAEQALRESEERFRVAQELSPDGFLIFRPLRDNSGAVTDFLWVYENDAAGRLNDTNPKEVCGKRVSEVLPHHEKSLFHKAYKEVAETGEVRVVEEAFYDQDTFQRKRWFRVVAVPTAGGDVAILVQDVTARKTAEEAVRESEARLRFALESCQIGAWDIDLVDHSAFRSPEHDRIFGYDQLLPQWTLSDFLKHALPEHREPVDKMVREATAAQTGWTYECPIRRADGELRWIWFSGRHRIDASGHPRVVGVVQDITERRAAGEALRRSEARWNAAIESFAEGAIIATEDEQVIYWNPAARAMHGFTGPDEGIEPLERTPATFHLWTADGSHMLELDEWPMRRIKRGETVRNLELRIRRPDQEWEKVFSYSGSMVDTAGGERLIFLTCKDLTELRKAEDALKKQAELLRLSYDAMIVWTVDGAIESWNVGAERLYGYSESEAIGKLTHSLLATRFPKPWEEIRSEIGKVGVWEGELRHQTREGREVVVSTRLQVIKGPDGIERVLEVNRDITERKQAEERLLQSQKLESLGLLAGGVAHDFNNLLVGVIGNASMAQEMLPPDHPAAELVGTVLKTGEQAAHLTRQMLAYSGKGRFLLEPLDISALAGDIIELVRPSIPKKIALRLYFAEYLPPIEADRGQVQQILMNLAINAAEAIGSHDGRITVSTGTQEVDEEYFRRHPEAAELAPGEYVMLEVADDGCGMDAATKARIFDPFFSTKFTGRGLGLAAVAGIVRGHKGKIVVTSAQGKGTTFTVLFPPAGQPAERSLKASSKPVPQGSGVVLVIDDEQVVRDMARKALERHGYTVLVADGGPAAIDILKRHPVKIDLAILDLSMPGMSGEETLPELRKIRPEVKVFISSGFSEAEAMSMFKGQRVSGFVHKPYTSAALAEKVKTALV